MYVAPAAIDRLAARYGIPRHVEFSFAVDEAEYLRIKASQKQGRKHDFTLYIVKDDRIVVIAKHSYPPDLFRAPSGGLRPGENVVEGVKREAMEETGCRIELERFLLHAAVSFTNDLGVIDWDTYLFQAHYVSGDFRFTDHKEIREVRLVTLHEFETFSTNMRNSSVGGWHYRAALHDAVKGLLKLK